ncbi:MAG: potassium channel family protein, partial [Crocinitomicaceae bacterium]|nr:potassium channel family protein [Crocinitomicaceae bacterium]
SLREYRKIHGFEETSFVDFLDVDFKNCFFDCELNVDFSYANFNGNTEFRNATFSNGGVTFYNSNFNGSDLVDFRKTAFGKGIINFQYVKFGERNLLFSFAKFYGGMVSFVNTEFGDGSIMFNSVNFYDSKVKFHFSKFGVGDVEFQKAKFGNQTIDFRRVEFGEGKVDFRRTTFGNGYVTFNESEMIDGRFKFSSARFGDTEISFDQFDFGKAEVLFENVDFGRGSVSFEDVKVDKISFYRSKINVYMNFCVNRANHVNFSEVVLRDIIDMQTNGENVKIERLYLTGMRNLGRFIFSWEDNELKKMIVNQSDSTLEEKAEQFVTIKENFSMGGRYEEEDLAYLQFKRYEYRGEMQHIYQGGAKEYWRLPGMAFKWLVFDKMGKYATSPLRVLLSMILVYVLFSLAFFVLPYLHLGGIANSVDHLDHLNNLQVSFYHSAITFLTIGYGDYYPLEYGRGLSIIEGWAGLFLMSYFTVAFVRKILR